MYVCVCVCCMLRTDYNIVQAYMEDPNKEEGNHLTFRRSK